MLYMNSISEDSGKIAVNVFFKVGTNPDDAKIDVNNRVQAALSKLPEQVQRQGVSKERQVLVCFKVIMFILSLIIAMILHIYQIMHLWILLMI